MLKKIRIQRVSIFDIVATLVLAVVLVAFAVQGTGELAQMQTATDDYIQCETLARQLQSGSDYLIEQVRMYTATGQREYMDNYFENLNVTRRRETALEYFGENYGDKTWRDFLGNREETVTTAADGEGTFTCNGGSVSVWVIEDAL